MHILAEMRTDQRKAFRVPDIRSFRRRNVFPERQFETDVPRPATLRERRRGDVRRSERFENIFQGISVKP